MKPIYLRIAGFNIKIHFSPSRFPDESNTFREEIINTYSLVIHEDISRNDCTLTFKDDAVNEIYFLPENEEKSVIVFTNFFKKTGRHRFTTSYNLSMLQFHQLLLHSIKELLIEHGGFLLQCTGYAIGGNTILTLPPAYERKEPKIISQSAMIRTFGNHFYCYQYPFSPKTIENKKYPIDKIIFYDKKINEALVGKVLPLTNIPKLFEENVSDSRYKQRVMDTFLSLLAKIDYQPSKK